MVNFVIVQADVVLVPQLGNAKRFQVDMVRNKHKYTTDVDISEGICSICSLFCVCVASLLFVFCFVLWGSSLFTRQLQRHNHVQSAHSFADTISHYRSHWKRAVGAAGSAKIFTSQPTRCSQMKGLYATWCMVFYMKIDPVGSSSWWTLTHVFCSKMFNSFHIFEVLWIIKIRSWHSWIRVIILSRVNSKCVSNFSSSKKVMCKVLASNSCWVGYNMSWELMHKVTQVSFCFHYHTQ